MSERDETEGIEDEREMTAEEREAKIQEMMGGAPDGLREALMGMMGIEEPDPVTEAQNELRKGIQGDVKPQPFGMLSMIMTKEDGTNLLISAAIAHGGDHEELLAKANEYVRDVVLPVLLPDQQVVVRLHEFSAQFLMDNAAETLDITALDKRALAFRKAMIAKRYEGHTALYEKCKDCDDDECPIRVTKPPTDVE